MFMDDYAPVVILGPIIAPVAWKLGVDPLQIEAIICVNLVIGLSTPPFGIALFVTSPMVGVKIEETFKEALPLIAVTILVLFLITYIPQITLWLPRACGY
jgi:TRAP-type C4-dicarboxylate transport system permease large subunit